MEFIDLKKQYGVLKEDIDKSIQNVLNYGHYINGEEVETLSKQLAEYVGAKYCLPCANGTDALTLALRCLDVKKGDAVFVPDFTFFASAEVISLEQATPIFVDVDSRTFNISVESLEKAINAVIKEGKYKPKAVVAVDLFGQPANYINLRKIADKYNLFIIEDGAQGFGGSINGKKSCSFGDISTTSFFPAKPLGCYGDGGAIFTDNLKYYELMKSLAVHGKGDDKYDNVRIGYNSRLDTLQAAILLPKLKAFKEYELDNRNCIANIYTEALKENFRTPIVPENVVSSWAQYTLILDNKEQREKIQAKLKSQGIPTMVYYPIPMHKQGAYKENLKCDVDLGVSEILCECVMSIPMHPYLTSEDINTVCKVLIEAK